MALGQFIARCQRVIGHRFGQHGSDRFVLFVNYWEKSILLLLRSFTHASYSCLTFLSFLGIIYVTVTNGSSICTCIAARYIKIKRPINRRSSISTVHLYRVQISHFVLCFYLQFGLVYTFFQCIFFLFLRNWSKVDVSHSK